MFNKSAVSLPVLIVGAGPTGLTVASELCRRGIPFRIIEKRMKSGSHSKAISISASTLELFRSMGVLDAFLAKGRKVHDIFVHSQGKRVAHVDYRHLKKEAGIENNFLLSLAQPESEAILEKHLEDNGGRIERGVQLGKLNEENKWVQATLVDAEGIEERAHFSYVVGCDGHQSEVRKQLGISLEGGAYDTSFILGDFRVKWEGDKNSVHYFMRDGRFSLIVPMPEGWHRVVIQVPQRNPEDVYPELSAQVFEHALQIQWDQKIHLGDSRGLSHAKLFHFVAEKAQKGRMFLAGDALHQFSPVGGQGMNTGVQDGFNIAWKIAYVLRGWASPTLLETYETERKGIADALVKSCDASMQLLLQIEGLSPPLKKMQAGLVSSMANRDRQRKEFPFSFSGMSQRYSEGRWIKDFSTEKSLINGQGMLFADHKPGAGFRAMNLGPGTVSGHRLIVVGKSGEINPQLVELGVQYREWLTVKKMDASPDRFSEGEWFLLRPDGYIEAHGDVNSQGALEDYLKERYSGGNSLSVPRYAAFFDVDDTVINLSSLPNFLEYFCSQSKDQSEFEKRRLVRFKKEFEDLKNQGSSRADLNRKYYEAFSGVSVHRVSSIGRAWLTQLLSKRGNDFFIHDSLALLREHQAGGGEVVFVSGSFSALLAPLAELLGVKRWIGAPLEIEQGRYTGRLLSEPTIGPGKATAIRKLMNEELKYKPAECFAYGDHESDIPMLREVGHGCLVNRQVVQA